MAITKVADTDTSIETSATTHAVAEEQSAKLPKPAAALPLRFNTRRALVLLSLHVMALAALLPWCFSWTGVALVLIGHHLFGMLGISLCYHRLLTHRSLVTPKWFERTLACLLYTSDAADE